MNRTFTAVYQRAEEGGYVAWIEELPGANTQGETLEETRENLREVAALILDVRRERGLQEAADAELLREELVVAI
jgi:predicted RNase H-like HicB family nuclease